MIVHGETNRCGVLVPVGQHEELKDAIVTVAIVGAGFAWCETAIVVSTGLVSAIRLADADPLLTDGEVPTTTAAHFVAVEAAFEAQALTAGAAVRRVAHAISLYADETGWAITAVASAPIVSAHDCLADGNAGWFDSSLSLS